MAKIGTNEVKSKTLSELVSQPLEIKLAIAKHYLSVYSMLINEILEEDVRILAGERYKREKPNNGRYSRWGHNPGSVIVGEEKVKIEVPRVYDKEEEKNVSLESYKKLRENEPDDDRLLKGVLYGLSMSDYGGVVRYFTDSFGLSRSKVSERFIEESTSRLREFSERDLSEYNFVGLLIDGKYLAKEQIVILLGVTEEGDKIPIDFIQTHTENSRSIKEVLERLKSRGFKYEDGILVVIDGAKGIRKAIEESFGVYAVVQRCQWHKRENVISYLTEKNKEIYKLKLNSAYNQETYEEAVNKLIDIRDELKAINKDAAGSLEEGLEETLTLHRLGVNLLFSKSFSTTNMIENLNSQLNKYIGRVKYWKTSDQRHRWVGCGLLEIEARMRKVNNYNKLYILKEKLKQEVHSRLNYNLGESNNNFN